MAIRAKQPEIAFIRFPILESSSPNVLAALGFHLPARVDVVDIERPVVIESAFFAFTSEFGDKREFARPIPRAFMYFVSVFIPEIPKAFRAAESVFTLLAAVLAGARLAPARSEIARDSTIFRAFMFGGWFLAMSAFIHG